MVIGIKKKNKIGDLKIGNQVLLLFITLMANSAIIVLILLFWLNGNIYSNVINSVKDVNMAIKSSIEQSVKMNQELAEQTVRYFEDTDFVKIYLKEETNAEMISIIYNISRDVVPDFLYSYIYNISSEEKIYITYDEKERYLHIVKDYSLNDTRYKDPFYTKIYYDEKSKTDYYAYIYPVSNKESNHIESYYVMIHDFKIIKDTVTRILNDDGVIFSIYEKDQLVYNSHNEILASQNVDEGIKNGETVSFFETISGDHYFVQISFIDNTDWKYVIYIPRIKIFSDIIIMLLAFLGISIILVSVAMGFFIGIKRSISKPIDHIIYQLENIDDYTEHQRIEVDVNNEISSIVNHMNIMLGKIHGSNKEIISTQSRLYEMELGRAEAELSYYQSQINPHFLYNNLEFIRSLGAIYNIPEVEKISVAMSQIFRYSIKGNNIVSLEEELDCIRNYFSIMDLRFPNKYKMLIRIEGEAQSIQLPKMILQPVVENAFKHGFVKRRNKGYLLIRIFAYEDCYCLEIIDTGIGISQDRIHEINDRLIKEDYKTDMESMKKIGLDNVNNRLRIQYGEGYGVQVKSREGYYTKVILKIKRNVSP
ncbi:sensor histidine kinase [Vallitalea okinawensis]|uniref:sensor histidine kinase n=1 Tax=Vallitalea okinawensis TaxID=2078660 RepID=UPI000CFB4504|nr:histidine kinase [Vallitalea okinawensis]